MRNSAAEQWENKKIMTKFVKKNKVPEPEKLKRVIFLLHERYSSRNSSSLLNLTEFSNKNIIVLSCVLLLLCDYLAFTV